MFWSHDLLGKKTALAAVWVAAHGKKLNKGSIMKVNIAEACDKVIDPEAPHALRLQAILVGGIVFVHAKQQYFLLEDVQEMLVGAAAAGGDCWFCWCCGEAAGEAAAAKVTLGGEKRAAREEAITLPLNGDLALLNLGDLSIAFRHRRTALTPSATPSPLTRIGGGSEAAAAEGAGFGGGLLLGQGQEEIALSLDGLPRHDLELLDQPETFAVPDIDLPGMDFFGGPAPGDALPDDLLPVPSGLLGEAAPADLQGVDQPPASQTPQSSGERSGSLGGGAAPKTKPRRRGGKKRSKPTVDDLDTLQIRGRDYRDWMNERGDILVARPQRALGAAGAAGAAGAKSALVVAPATAAAMPGGAWPEELLVGAGRMWNEGLFMRHAVLPKAEGARPQKGKKGGKGQEEEEDVLEEQERYLDEMAAGGRGTLLADDGLGFAGGEAGFGAPAFMDGGYLDVGMDGYGGYAEEAALGGDGAGPSNQFARRAALRAPSGDEESEEEFDVETERLRAALNSTQGMGEPFYLGLTPGSAPDMGGAAAGLGGRRKRGSSALRRDSESQGVLSEKSSERRGGSRLSDLLEDAPLSGAELGAMLPAVGEEEELEEEEEEGSEGASAKRRRSGEASGNGLSQFELLEASGPTQEVGGFAAGGAGPAAGDHLTKATLAFVNLMRQRFDAAESQLEGGEEEEAPAELSLDSMTERLGRLDAAKAFYAALVARSHGFLQLEQEEPYGDITLRRGQYL
ncbi:hypothetical protein COHA_009260 [Chlorella ohadii]|uniref:Uncharacterized protein n=1 Tax=Chlorella ohadii TaxID=2649997 RepID=A0AAD5H0U3_9CHLO|nr:hypothetical protein COHA_009260 [Chlorella ohadii]